MNEDQRKQLSQAQIDIDTVLTRFSNNEAFLLKYLFKFPEEPTFGSLKAAYSAGSEIQIKENIHTLKGIAGNLGLTTLYEAASHMHKNIKDSKKETLPHDYEKVTAAYNHYVETIKTAR